MQLSTSVSQLGDNPILSAHVPPFTAQVQPTPNHATLTQVSSNLDPMVNTRA